MSKKLLIYGAFGRHNLGDMLFPWIIYEYLRVEGVECDVEYADLLPRDMRYMGGHYVKGISDFFDCPQEVNLFVAGGEVGRCGLLEALGFLEPTAQDVQSLSRLFALFSGFPAYLPRKSCFLNPGSFLAGALGGFLIHVLPYWSSIHLFTLETCLVLSALPGLRGRGELMVPCQI